MSLNLLSARDATDYCKVLVPNPDIAGLGVFLAIAIQTFIVILAGLAFSIGSFLMCRTTDRTEDLTQNGDDPHPEHQDAMNNIAALSRLLFAVFDTQPIVSVAIYIAFIINAAGLIDSTGQLTNYHMRNAVHLQALSGIQLVIPLALVFDRNRRRQLRFGWFEIHFCFLVGLSRIQIFLQRESAQSILPLARESQCFGDRSWSSLKSAYATGTASLVGYIFLVVIAIGHVIIFHEERTPSAQLETNPPSEGSDESPPGRAAKTRLLYEVILFLYLTAFAVSQIFIIQLLRAKYRQIWGSAEDVWGFGQVLAMVTMIPVTIDYLEAIIIGIDRSISASVIRQNPENGKKFAELYVQELVSRLIFFGWGTKK